MTKRIKVARLRSPNLGMSCEQMRRWNQIQRGELTCSNGLVVGNTHLKCDSHGNMTAALMTERLLPRRPVWDHLSNRTPEPDARSPQQILDEMQQTWDRLRSYR